MNLGFALVSATAGFPEPAGGPSQAAQLLQLAQGGGSDTARDRIVRNDGRRRALVATGARLATRHVVERAGVTRPAAAHRA